MGTRIKFTPLYGAHTEGPLSYLLEVDDFKFLLDCGWNDSFDLSYIKQLESVIAGVDAVLLSHPDTLHLGALPFAVGKLGLTATVYCTLPVRRMGQFSLYEQIYCRQAVSNFEHYSLDDVDNAFETSVQLKFCQHWPLEGKGTGITITPYRAGHLLGGTIWKVSKESEDIIYAVDYNHRKERHLDGTVLLSDSTLVRPAVLITDSYNSLQPMTTQQQRKERDTAFLDTILKVLRADGNVLLPVDPAGRILELVLYLDEFWQENKLPYPLALLTRTSVGAIEFAKSSIEWMSERITKSFEATRDNAFALKKMQLLSTREQFDALPSGPKVVLASMLSLESGESRRLFSEWAGNPKNLILFTERAQEGSLGWMLQQKPKPDIVAVELSKKTPLEGDELDAFLAEKRRLEQERLRSSADASAPSEAPSAPEGTLPEAPSGGTLERSPSLKGAEAGGSSSGGGVKRPRYNGVLVEGFVPSPNTAAPMFPFEEYNKTKTMTEYGEAINPDDYIIAEPEFVDLSITKKAKRDDEEEEDVMWKPSKITTWTLKVEVRCEVQSADFEGLADGQSMKKILSRMAPAKMVLVHGSVAATQDLCDHCLRHICPSVFTPLPGETVDISSTTNAFKVKLTEELMHSVMLKKIGEYEVAWVDGEAGAQDEDMYPLLPLSAGPPPAHKAIFVGDLRLADFRQVLASKGMQSEFVGGALRCSENVVVRKSVGGAQQLVIEGALSEDYYKIRDVLYSQFSIM